MVQYSCVEEEVGTVCMGMVRGQKSSKCKDWMISTTGIVMIIPECNLHAKLVLNTILKQIE